MATVSEFCYGASNESELASVREDRFHAVLCATMNFDQKFFDAYISKACESYPETAKAVEIKNRLSPLLLCPEPLRLPRRLKAEAEEIVSAFFALRELPKRSRKLEELEPTAPDPGNSSILMSYDFHVDEGGKLRLIEINTNASLSLLTELSYETMNIENEFSSSFRSEIFKSFMEEWQLAKIRATERPQAIAITDEDPEKQKLFIEFLFYKELFEKNGIETQIVDAKTFSFTDGTLKHEDRNIDLVYNRHTDFYFETENTRALRSAQLARAACISPNPHEYRLLADKERLLELSRPGAIEALDLTSEQKSAISSTLIRTLETKDFADPDTLWKERKKWFFKPKRSFGGKATYRGSSMSRNAFAGVVAGEFLAQEYVPAPVVKRGEPAEDFKYDLRFYVYRDKIQIACARIYQGQMTNSQTPGGGLAPLIWD